MADGYINDGTATATAGSKTVTFAGVSVSLFRAGWPFNQGGASGTIASLDADTNTATLVDNWGGDDSSAAAYSVLTIPSSRVLAETTTRWLEYLNGPILSIAQMMDDAAPSDGETLVWDTAGWVATSPAGSLLSLLTVDDNIIQRKAGAVVQRTMAQLLTDLGTAGAATKAGAETLTNKTLGAVTLPGSGQINSSGDIFLGGSAQMGVGGVTGTGQVFAQSATEPSMSLLKTGTIEWTASVDSNNALAIGSGGVNRFFFINSNQFGAGGNAGTGHIFAQAASNPTISILKTGIADYLLRVESDNYLHIGTSSTASLVVASGGNYVAPGSDNVLSNGTSSLRWSVVYAGTGSINTSGAETKTGLRVLSDAEVRVATALASSGKVYQFCDAVEAKGENVARLHVGLIYEEVVAAFEAEGLDPMRYGIVCRDRAMKTVQKTRPAKREKMQEVQLPHEQIAVIDGKAVMTVVMEASQQHVLQTLPMFDAAGQPVMVEAGRSPRVDVDGAPLLDADGKQVFDIEYEQRVHVEPVMEDYDEPYDDPEPDFNADGSEKWIFGLRYGELSNFIQTATAQRLTALEAA